MKILDENRKWIPIFFMALIFVESSIPMDGGPDNIMFLTNLDPKIQNLLHIPLYGILAFLWMNFFCEKGIPSIKIVSCVLAISISYAFLDEIHQTFVRGRYGSLNDICFDSIGTILGVISYWTLKRRQIQG